MDRGRLESFSDGVFAVAITLLALNLAVPGPGHHRLLNLLGHSWPAFAAYVISFFTIGVIWVNHRSLFSGLAHIAAALYGVVMTGMGISFALIFGWAIRRGLMTEPMTPKARRDAQLRFGLGMVVYIIATGVSFLSAPAALACYGAVAAYYVLEHTPAGPTAQSD
jgi:uncharacterized membrane protein